MKKHCLCIVLCSFVFLGTAPPEPAVYTVRSGDTLSRIAAVYLPYTSAYTRRELIASLRKINGIDGPLSIGQSLKIPVSFNEPVKARTVPRPKEYPATGLYMNPSSAGTRFIFESAQRLKELGGNTIVFDAKDDLGAITYPSPIPGRYCPDEKYRPSIEELPKLIEFLHRMDIHVVARVVAFRDPIMSRNRPWWCIDREHHWLDPAHSEVQEYLLTVVRELSDSGVDEIQLDYIRYHADGATSTGIEGLQRTDVIASFLKKVREITAPRGVLLSVDMFGIVIWQRDVDVLVVGQDIAKMKPHVDIISPMLYPSHFSSGFAGVKNPADEPYRFVHRGVKRMKDIVGDEVIVRPWLQSFPLRVTRGFDASYIQDQIDASRDAGGTGWLLWSPGNRYGEAYAALHELMHPEPEVRKASSSALPGALPEQPGPAGEAPETPVSPGADNRFPSDAPRVPESGLALTPEGAPLKALRDTGGITAPGEKSTGADHGVPGVPNARVQSKGSPQVPGGQAVAPRTGERNTAETGYVPKARDGRPEVSADAERTHRCAEGEEAAIEGAPCTRGTQDPEPTAVPQG
jgi:hypothetical protein